MTQETATARSATPSVPMTAEQRAAFERDGYLIIRGALCPDEVAGAATRSTGCTPLWPRRAHWARTGRCTC